MSDFVCGFPRQVFYRRATGLGVWLLLIFLANWSCLFANA